MLAAFANQVEFEPAIYVLANGSTDGTVPEVQKLASAHPNVHLIEIPFGDKAHAWNHYVFERAPRAAAHLFMDGDLRMGPEAGPMLLKALAAEGEARAAAAVPSGGRHAKRYRQEMLQAPVVWGCLYALRDSVLQMFRDRGRQLPIGHLGEDGLVGFLVAKDLDPRGPNLPGRVIAVDGAFFDYTPIRWYSASDLKTYFKRRVSYSVRFYQFQFLGPRIRSHGLEEMPRNIAELYGVMDRYRRPFRGGLNLVFDRLAWKRMIRARREFESHSGTGPEHMPVHTG